MSELDELLRSVQDWAARTFPPPGEHETTCQWCPLCQLMAVLRGERPDVGEKVAEAGSALLAVLRTVVDAAGGAAEPDPDKPRVQRIDLGGD